MPIPASRYRPTNLTREQRQDQLAACYGVTEMSQLSHEEIERMRQIVQEHDSVRKPIQTIDLNNPPKEHYRHQEFPKMVYGVHQGKRVHLVVRNAAELRSAIEDGWTEDVPQIEEAREDHIKPEYQREADQVQEQINVANRRRKAS
jgi:hypothetical protein